MLALGWLLSNGQVQMKGFPVCTLNDLSMAKKTKQEEDILWNMLSSEMAMPEVREMQQFLEGETEHFEMGYGDLNIEPYDARGGRSRMFRIRHTRYGETIVSHAALRSVLHDLVHHLRREL
jgi:hypothetical protein